MCNAAYPSLWYHGQYFQRLQILCALLMYFSQCSPTGRPFYSPHSLAFPECHIIVIIQYVAYSGWCISLSNMRLKFLHVFHGFRARFFLVLNNIPLSGYNRVYLSIHLLKDILVASKFLQF